MGFLCGFKYVVAFGVLPDNPDHVKGFFISIHLFFTGLGIHSQKIANGFQILNSLNINWLTESQIYSGTIHLADQTIHIFFDQSLGYRAQWPSQTFMLIKYNGMKPSLFQG